MVKTFAELEGSESVTFEELQACLEDYAVGGWAISARVVIKIVDKVDPSLEQLNELSKSALGGFDNQSNRRQTKTADEYWSLLRHLRVKFILKGGIK